MGSQIILTFVADLKIVCHKSDRHITIGFFIKVAFYHEHASGHEDVFKLKLRKNRILFSSG